MNHDTYRKKERVFRAGDRVVDTKYPEWGTGKVVAIRPNKTIQVVYDWNSIRVMNYPAITRHKLQFAETPIQRMKRLYSEKE